MLACSNVLQAHISYCILYAYPATHNCASELYDFTCRHPAEPRSSLINLAFHLSSESWSPDSRVAAAAVTHPSLETTVSRHDQLSVRVQWIMHQ